MFSNKLVSLDIFEATNSDRVAKLTEDVFICIGLF